MDESKESPKQVVFLQRRISEKATIPPAIG